MPFFDGWWNSGSWFPLFPVGFMILCLFIMVVVMMSMMRGMGAERRPAGSALEVLNERLARGEIDCREYEERRRIIAR